ncbi:hypothetical protein ACT4S5_13250 [Kocuria oceani]|uniref:hypothetical protein n=1 Tax=Kocuria oceani TaxID=988827 RepID=UPI0040365BAE
MSKMTMWRALRVLLAVGAVAALWWAVSSGEPAAWAIFFCLCSMNISVSALAGRAARRKE